mgnify:CR=1 FL=1
MDPLEEGRRSFAVACISLGCAIILSTSFILWGWLHSLFMLGVIVLLLGLLAWGVRQSHQIIDALEKAE